MSMWFEKKNNGVVLRVYLGPGASKNELCGLFGDPQRLKLKVKAPPVAGAANKELIKFLARSLGLKKADMMLINGFTARNKDILITGDLDQITRKILTLI